MKKILFSEISADFESNHIAVIIFFSRLDLERKISFFKVSGHSTEKHEEIVLHKEDVGDSADNGRE